MTLKVTPTNIRPLSNQLPDHIGQVSDTFEKDIRVELLNYANTEPTV